MKTLHSVASLSIADQLIAKLDGVRQQIHNLLEPHGVRISAVIEPAEDNDNEAEFKLSGLAKNVHSYLEVALDGGALLYRLVVREGTSVKPLKQRNNLNDVLKDMKEQGLTVDNSFPEEKMKSLYDKFAKHDLHAYIFYQNKQTRKGDAEGDKAADYKGQMFKLLKSITDKEERQKQAVKWQHAFSNGGRNDDAMIQYHKELGTKWRPK